LADSSADKPIFRLEEVSKRFNGTAVLDRVDLGIARGCTTAIIGPSGCGKTVLLKHLIGLLRPDGGRVFFEDTDITHLSEKHLVQLRRRVGYLFQRNALFDSMTVAENIHFPLAEHGWRDRDRLEQRCREVLRMVGLDGMQDRMPENLSGGQQKRVALARAIALAPDVILYDEPTTGLDPVRSDLINELILKLQSELNATSVVVTHDMNSARKIADRILMLHEGRILADTTPGELEDIQDDTVVRFVQGRATAEELGELTSGQASQGGDHDR